MSFKPDYGLRLQRDGLSPEVDITIYGFRLFSLSVLGFGQFSTCAEMKHDGEYHAVSLDFSLDQLLQILETAPVEVLEQLQGELLKDLETPRTIDLAAELTFDVCARLGTVQQNADESYVPLIVHEVLNNRGQTHERS